MKLLFVVYQISELSPLNVLRFHIQILNT